MKNIACLFLMVCASSFAFAQFSKDQRIEDSVIGWWDNNKFDKGIKPTTDPVQLKRISQLDNLVQWIKKSYTPVAGLGTYRRENLKTSSGVRFMIWNVSYNPLWIDGKGHFTPVAEEQVSFGVFFNTIPASYPVLFLNGSGTYYFSWPADGFRSSSSSADRQEKADPKIHPNVHKYVTRSNESQIVILAPDNKLPFIPVSIGEYLTGAENSLVTELSKDPSSLNQTKFATYRSQMNTLKERYKDRLNEPAVIRSMQPTLNDFNGNVDPFFISEREKEQRQFHEIYKVPKDVMQEAQTDKVMWIAAWFNYETPEVGNKRYEIYRAMTEQLNYDYIYNYYFNPAAVKGKEYTPDNEKIWNDRMAAYRNKYKNSAVSINKKVMAAPAGSLFWEDFTSDAIGSLPAGWFAKANGKRSTISGLKNEKSNWLKLGYGNAVFPIGMKKPLPENFVLEFDVAGDPDFTGVSGAAINLRLSTAMLDANSEEKTGAKTSVDIKITAGLDANLKAGSNYRGSLRVDIHSDARKNVENNKEGLYYNQSQSEFTDKKTNTHVKVEVVKGILKVQIDGKQTATSASFKLAYGRDCVDCALPAGTRFNTVAWTNVSADGETTGAYISNIKLAEKKEQE